MALTLLTGGARSGKSTAAVEAARRAGRATTLIATGQAIDGEMADRIARHRASRPAGWVVIEEPVELEQAISRVDPRHTLLIDCLTLWVSNLVYEGSDADDIEDRARHAAAAAARRDAPTVVVTNEVGSGIVPVDADVRRWRDLLGRVNAVFASDASDVYLVVAGRLVRLEPAEALRLG